MTWQSNRIVAPRLAKTVPNQLLDPSLVPERMGSGRALGGAVGDGGGAPAAREGHPRGCTPGPARSNHHTTIPCLGRATISGSGVPLVFGKAWIGTHRVNLRLPPPRPRHPPPSPPNLLRRLSAWWRSLGAGLGMRRSVGPPEGDPWDGAPDALGVRGRRQRQEGEGPNKRTKKGVGLF